MDFEPRYTAEQQSSREEVRAWRGWKRAIVYRKWPSQPMDHQPSHQKVVH